MVIGLKWQILLKVLPFTITFCLLKVSIHLMGWEFWEFDSLTGTLFGAATFVVALVLSGTLSDYRASEQVPSQIVNALEGIHDINLMLAAAHPSYNPQVLRDSLAQIALALDDWLTQGKELAIVLQALEALNPLFAPVMELGGSAIANRVHTEQAKIRLLVTQIQVNRDTGFLAPAYVLLGLFLAGASIALLLIQAARFSETLTISAFMFTALIYLFVFIRDLDNPFQYDGRSSMDVDLSPLKEIGDRLRTL
jgi:hypothetical protein